MKKIIFVLILISAIAFISSRAVKVADNEANSESLTAKKASVGSPRILYILNNDAGLTSWSPSLWWIYQPGQGGC
jgi:hypothetical protein